MANFSNKIQQLKKCGKNLQVAQKFATKKSSYGGGLNRHSEPNTMAHQQYQNAYVEDT